MRLAAIALDQHGFVAEVNAAAEAVFDNDFRIKDRRLFVRDPAARAILKEIIDQLRASPRLNPLATDPIIVQRQDKMPVIVRIWPFDWAAHLPTQEVRALLTLNALGPKPQIDTTKRIRLDRASQLPPPDRPRHRCRQRSPREAQNLGPVAGNPPGTRSPP